MKHFVVNLCKFWKAFTKRWPFNFILWLQLNDLKSWKYVVAKYMQIWTSPAKNFAILFFIYFPLTCFPKSYHMLRRNNFKVKSIMVILKMHNSGAIGSVHWFPPLFIFGQNAVLSNISFQSLHQSWQTADCNQTKRHDSKHSNDEHKMICNFCLIFLCSVLIFL